MSEDENPNSPGSLMKFTPDHQFRNKIENAIAALLSSDPCQIRDFVAGIYKDCREQGIYAITNPGDYEIVYIGKTNRRKDGIGGRVRQHASKKRNLQKKLKVDGINDYYVRVHPIADASIRGAAELYAIAVYMPKGNRIALETEGDQDFEPKE
jgi:hypothetical protein